MRKYDAVGWPSAAAAVRPGTGAAYPQQQPYYGPPHHAPVAQPARRRRGGQRPSGDGPGDGRRGDRAARRLCRQRRAARSAPSPASPTPASRSASPCSTARSRTRFSVPGGYVYITRQLMALMDDEAELAFALGHEVAHIAANHAHIRQAYAQRNPLGRVRADPRRVDGPVGVLQPDQHPRQARYVELLARSGISGRPARPRLS